MKIVRRLPTFKLLLLFVPYICSCNASVQKNVRAERNRERIPRDLLFDSPERTMPLISPEWRSQYLGQTIGQNDDVNITDETKQRILLGFAGLRIAHKFYSLKIPTATKTSTRLAYT